MQKTKSKISKTFVYQFETHFHIESSTDNITLDFSDSKYLGKSTEFITDLKIESIEIVHLNSHPPQTPLLIFNKGNKGPYFYLGILF
jgi:hypothetical protein